MLCLISIDNIVFQLTRNGYGLVVQSVTLITRTFSREQDVFTDCWKNDYSSPVPKGHDVL